MKLLPAGLSLLPLLAAASLAADPLLKPEAPVAVAGSKGSFDFIQVDGKARRLLANHTGNGSLDIFDLETGKLLKRVATGSAQGVGVDEVGGHYFVGVSKEKKLVIVDAKTLEKTGEVALPGPADDVIFDVGNGLVYAGCDDGTEVWVINPAEKKITATITIPEGPEVFACDPSTHRVFLNVKSTSVLVAMDDAANKVADTWTTQPAAGPHGLAFNPATHRLYAAGNNGKLAILDSVSGQVKGSVGIAAKVDQIAMDHGLRRIYCASHNGGLSVVEETEAGGKLLGEVKTPKGARSVAVDQATHAVWIAYTEGANCFIQRYTLEK